jgi:cell division protein FtsN
MARDYRYKKSVVIEPDPNLPKEVEKGSGLIRSILAMVVILATAFGGYKVINHFASKSSAKKTTVILESETVVEDVKKQAEEVSEILETPKKVEPSLDEKEEIKTFAEKDVLSQTENAEQTSQELDFYDALMNMEVSTGDVEVISVELDRPFYIIAGSFRNQSSAQREHSRLTKAGFELTLYESTSNNRPIFYLKTKSFTDRLELNSLRNRLKSHGAHVLVLPVR